MPSPVPNLRDTPIEILFIITVIFMLIVVTAPLLKDCGIESKPEVRCTHVCTKEVKAP